VGTKILAEQFILQELGKGKESLLKMEDKLNLLNKVLERARIISYLNGPIIFVKIEKEFYRSIDYKDYSDKSG
jgi:predicted DNA-binding protein YlxM (UPF0122 family)